MSFQLALSCPLCPSFQGEHSNWSCCTYSTNYREEEGPLILPGPKTDEILCYTAECCGGKYCYSVNVNNGFRDVLGDKSIHLHWSSSLNESGNFWRANCGPLCESSEWKEFERKCFLWCFSSIKWLFKAPTAPFCRSPSLVARLWVKWISWYADVKLCWTRSLRPGCQIRQATFNLNSSKCTYVDFQPR